MLIDMSYEKEESIPEGMNSLYTEKDGKWSLTGIKGLKTQSDVDTVMSAKNNEVNLHKATKEKLALWGERDITATLLDLDKIEEYKILAEGKMDEEKIAQLVESRLKTATGPLERERDTLTKDMMILQEENVGFKAENIKRQIHDDIRAASGPSKVISTAMEDVLMLAERVFEVGEDGKARTKDGMGVTPGIEADIWLQEMGEKRPHWWPASQGGGSNGSGNKGPGMASNPWSRGSWNVTAQAAYYKANGKEKAVQMAKSAGVEVTSTKPAAE